MWIDEYSVNVVWTLQCLDIAIYGIYDLIIRGDSRSILMGIVRAGRSKQKLTQQKQDKKSMSWYSTTQHEKKSSTILPFVSESPNNGLDLNIMLFNHVVAVFVLFLDGIFSFVSVSFRDTARRATVSPLF